MGEMADADHRSDDLRHALRAEPQAANLPVRVGDFMWRSAEGPINMYDMTPEHRENAMEVRRRKGNSGKLKQLQQVQDEMRKARPHEFSGRHTLA